MMRFTSITALLAASILLGACSFVSQAYYDFNDYVSLDGGSGVVHGGATLTVYFGFDSAAVSGEAKSDLGVLAANVSGRDSIGLAITGHTDTSGDAAYNQDLSLRRANAVRDELVSLGVASGQAHVSVNAEGESNPAVKTGDGVAEAANRRVTIQAVTKGGGAAYMGHMRGSNCPEILGVDAFCAWPENS